MGTGFVTHRGHVELPGSGLIHLYKKATLPLPQHTLSTAFLMGGDGGVLYMKRK